MKTNNLKFTATKLNVLSYGERADIIVNIRLNDECKNGHQDFSITADIYKAGRRGDRNFIAGGCCHKEILEHFPKFKIFVDLHLCDFNGAPMYPEANGLYHMQEGFNSKSTGEEFKKEYCTYYRITPIQFNDLKQAENKQEFSVLLLQLGIIEQWKNEAQKGIKTLEGLTGDEFLNDSTRSQYTEPTTEEINEYTRLKSEGYYLPEAKQERAKQAKELAKNKAINDLKERVKNETDKINAELNLRIYILESGLSIDNMIYYNHTNELVFNWQGYGKQLSENDFNYFVENADYSKLPRGIMIKRK